LVTGSVAAHWVVKLVTGSVAAHWVVKLVTGSVAAHWVLKMVTGSVAAHWVVKSQATSATDSATKDLLHLSVPAMVIHLPASGTSAYYHHQ